MRPIVLRVFFVCLGLCLGCVSVVTGASAQAEGPGRRALIIANWEYAALPQLINPPEDAAAYQAMLAGLGYEVSYHKNLDLDALDNAVSTFVTSIQKGDQIVVVYTGHGWSDGRENFLVPVDTPDTASETRLRGMSYPLRDGDHGLLDRIDAAGAAQTVAIIDACRNNPFKPKAGTKAIGYSRGLARISAPQGSFVIFSAGEGQEALDRLPEDPPEQKLSVFTRNLVPLLGKGLYLEDAVAEAQLVTATMALAYDNHLQHPAYYDETLGKTCLGKNCSDARNTVIEEQTTGLSASTLQSGLDQSPVAFDKTPPKAVDTNPLVLACDIAVQHAGNPDNPNAVPGVYLDGIDLAVAMRDCNAANAAFPDHDRTLYHLARIKVAQKDDEAAFAIYQTLAGRDYNIAIMQLASAYQLGRGTKVNLDLARRFFQIACDKKHSMSCAALGEMIFRGNGGEADKDAGLALMKGACDANSGYGCYLTGLYLDKDEATRDAAQGFFARSCDLDWMDGCAYYGMSLRRAATTTEEYLVALVPYDRACTAKVNWACRNIGYMYRDGKGPTVDLKMAHKYFSLACDLDDGQACNALAFLMRDDGAFAEAYPIFEKACALKNASACVTQGYMLETGEGIEADLQAGMALYELACGMNNATACKNMGSVLERTSYAGYSPSGSVEAYEKACQLKDGKSCLEAAFGHQDGKATQSDPAKVRAFFQASCDLDHGPGCRSLGYDLNGRDGSAAQQADAVAAFARGCALNDGSACAELGSANYFGRLGLKIDETAGLVQLQAGCGMERHAYACETLSDVYRVRGELENYLDAALRACDAGRSDPCAYLALSADELKLPRPALDLLVLGLERKSQVPTWFLDTMTAPQITLLQQALIKLGFYKGNADGKLGPATRAALDAVYKEG